MSTVAVLLTTFLCCVNAKVCFGCKCYCREAHQVIDCTKVGLHSLPQVKTPLENYTTLLLLHNHLRHFNFSSLTSVLPQVVLIDLRDNHPILCQDLLQFEPPTWIQHISDCAVRTTDNSITQPITAKATSHFFFTTSKSTTNPLYTIYIP